MTEKYDDDKMIRPAFTRKHDKKKGRDPIVVRHDKQGKLQEILEIGMYALNVHSKSGVLKVLAEMGLKKVILGDLGVKTWHKLTRGDRRRLIIERPKYYHFSEKGN